MADMRNIIEKMPSCCSSDKNLGKDIFLGQIYYRSVRFMETIELGDKTAVRFTWVFNNDVINKNTAIRFTRFQNSFETTSEGSF